MCVKSFQGSYWETQSVAARAVVTKDVPTYCSVVGNLAGIIKNTIDRLGYGKEFDKEIHNYIRV